MRLLAQKPLTETELRQRLQARGHDAATVDRTCRRLSEEGYLDDRKLASDFILARTERRGHGPRRLVEELCRRGVSREVAEATFQGVVEQGDVAVDELLLRQIRRRIGTADSIDSRAYRRVYNALRRAGFEDDAIRRQLQPLLEDPVVDDASY